MTKKQIKTFGTGDIETIIINGIHIPIALSLFMKGYCYTLTIDFRSTNVIEASKELLKKWIKDVIRYSTSNFTIYFHNLAKFDSYILMNELKNKEYQPKIILREGSIYEIKITSNGKEITFRDSYLLIPLSLKEAALIFNKTYFKKEFDFIEYNLEKYKVNEIAVETLKNYIENDVYTLYELLVRFKEFIKETFNNKIDEEVILKKLTIYSLTQHIFLKYYYEHKFVTLYANKDKEIRKSYIGGITDIYKPYGENLIMLDYNSMYPYIMTELILGIGHPKKDLHITNIDEYCKKPGFVKVEIKCKENLNQPVLALKYNNKIIQPVGIFTTVITNLELEYCLNNYKDYYEFKPLVGYSYEKSEIIFKEFMEVLYEKRLKTNNPIYKKMMNSLSGRFGMLVEKSMKNAIIEESQEKEFSKKKDIDILEIKNIDEKTFIYNYRNNKEGLVNDIELKKFKIRVDWSSMITAKGRLLIQDLKKLVNIYYVDTDAVVIEKKDLEKINKYIDNKALGKLKIVVDEIDEAVFIAPKCFALRKGYNYTFVIKGLNRRNIDLTDSELFDFFKLKLNKNNNETLKVFRKTDFKINLKNYEIKQASEKLELALAYDKREKIYNSEGIWVDTKPKLINNNIIKK